MHDVLLHVYAGEERAREERGLADEAGEVDDADGGVGGPVLGAPELGLCPRLEIVRVVVLEEGARVPVKSLEVVLAAEADACGDLVEGGLGGLEKPASSSKRGTSARDLGSF